MPLHVSSTMCSSSGGQNCIIQHLVSSHFVGGRPVHRLRDSSLKLCTRRPPTECDDTRCCIIQFWPRDDEHTVLETCRGIWYAYYKTIIFALSWLITKRNSFCLPVPSSALSAALPVCDFSSPPWDLIYATCSQLLLLVTPRNSWFYRYGQHFLLLWLNVFLPCQFFSPSSIKYSCSWLLWFNTYSSNAILH